MRKFNIKPLLQKFVLPMLFNNLIVIVSITIITIVFHFIKNGYVDWEHFLYICARKHHRFISISEYGIIAGTIIIFDVFKIFWWIIGYDNLLKKRFNVLENIPTGNDIKELLMLAGSNTMSKDVIISKILVPLINIKIQCIKNMNLLQKYSLIYTNNISGLIIGTLAMYRVSPVDINNILLLSNIHVPNYVSFDIISSKEIQSNVLNKNYYKGRATLMLQMVFNQYAIIKDVILQVFLSENEDNDIKLIKKYILQAYCNNTTINTKSNYIEENQIKNDNNNIITDKNNRREQLLISAIKENVSENLQFKEKFSEVLNNNYISKI